MGKASKERFNNDDIDIILTWLENSGNYESIWGTSGKTSIGLAPKTSSNGYRNLFEFLKAKSKRWNNNNLSPRAVKERFARYKSRLYMPAKAQIDATGFGVTDDDKINGISTIEHKKESMCHGYSRMEALFGSKPNVEPVDFYDGSLDHGRSTQHVDDFLESWGDSDGEPDDAIDEETTEGPGTEGPGAEATFDFADNFSTGFPDEDFARDGIEGGTLDEIDTFQEPDYETPIDDERGGQESQSVRDLTNTPPDGSSTVTIQRKRRSSTLDKVAASRKAPPSLRSSESSRSKPSLVDAVTFSADKRIEGN